MSDDGQLAALFTLVASAGVLIGYAIGVNHHGVSTDERMRRITWSEVRRDARILAWRAFRIWIGFPQRVRK